MAKAHLCAFVEQRGRGVAGLLITLGCSPLLAPLAAALILLLMGPRGELGQGKSRHSPPPLPRVFWNPRQPSPVGGVHQLAFPCRAHTALASAPYTSPFPACGPYGVPPPPPLCCNCPVAAAQTWHGGVLREPALVRSHARDTLCRHPTPVPGRIPIKKTNMKYHLELTECSPVYPVSSHLLSHLALTTVRSYCIIVKGSKAQRTGGAYAKLDSWEVGCRVNPSLCLFCYLSVKNPHPPTACTCFEETKSKPPCTTAGGS